MGQQAKVNWAVSDKPKLVHQCTNMKIGRKKVECLVREKRRNSAQKLNKVFIEPMRVEKVCIAKCALLDEIKEETPKVGCDFLT
ncbi:hypothetical protein YC2023_117342 [Brassica napus]|uniref:Uncharacterized protein n=1 Tax=Brassica oleracea TaxID=3712 RepID=A0A3P6EJK5_BRAOL|nr:unnamed protein product [Brassica oleracea]